MAILDSDRARTISTRFRQPRGSKWPSNVSASDLYGDYFYYGYRFEDATSSVAAVPRRVQSPWREGWVDFQIPASAGKDASCYQVRRTHRKTSSGLHRAANGRSSLPFVFIAIATVVVAHYLPNRYRSETVILVVPQQVPESYVRSTITSRIEDRLQSISQQILSRTRLERIIQDFNLYERERQIGIMEDVIERMRTRDINVDTLKGDAFRIAFIGDNPVTVMSVTDRLASHFIDENLRDREVLAQGTSQFLTVQLEDARRRLIEQEKKLEEYQLRHSGELPSQAAGNLQQVQNLQLQVQAVVESLNRDVDRKLIIERALADVRAVDVQALAAAAASGNASDRPVTVQLALARKVAQRNAASADAGTSRHHPAEATHHRAQATRRGGVSRRAACRPSRRRQRRRPGAAAKP